MSDEELREELRFLCEVMEDLNQPEEPMHFS
jgi:hypothetical protein